MSKTRIYEIAFIKSPPEMKSRLVRAGNVNQAIRHVADQIITGDVASQEALVGLLGEGVLIEDAGEEVAAKDAPEETKQLADKDAAVIAGSQASAAPTETQTSAATITELPAHMDRRQKAGVG